MTTTGEVQRILKILTAGEWATIADTGVFAGAPVDLADGFIHLSTDAQVAETLAMHFAGQTGLVLAALGPAAVEELRWDLAPTRGEEFPHLYRELRLDDIAWAAHIGDEAGGAPHILPSPDGPSLR